MPDMRVGSFNINGMHARLEFLLHWLQARQPDVVALQELKLEEERFPHVALEHAGYAAVAHGQKSWNGVAVLVRQGFGTASVVQRGLEAEAAQGARLLTTSVVPSAGAPLTVISVYVPNGKTITAPDFAAKLRWLDALSSYLQSEFAPTDRLLVAGDFNLCPSGADSWNESGFAGQIFHTAAERERFAALQRWGLADAYRNAEPESSDYSWWDYRAGAFHKNMGLRIDLVLVTASLAAGLGSASIDREYRKKKADLIASDHAPVLLEFEV
jgi:exodeoxyribonuclease-3